MTKSKDPELAEQPASTEAARPQFRQRLFSVSQAARYLGKNPKTLREMTDRKEIPAKNERGRRMYLREDLDRYCDQLPSWDT